MIAQKTKKIFRKREEKKSEIKKAMYDQCLTILNNNN